jgi:hypothetical protein
LWHCNNKLVMSILARSLLLLLLAMPSLVWGAEEAEHLHLRNPIVHSVDDHSFHNNPFTGKVSLSLSLSLHLIAFCFKNSSILHFIAFCYKHSSIHCLLFASQIQAFFIPLPFVCKSDSGILHSLAFLFSSLIEAFFIPLPFVFKSD